MAAKTFFQSAYALYDCFAELVRGTDKRLWLLSDPVEDDPNHEWAEFAEWYRQCVAAKLLFTEATAFQSRGAPREERSPRFPNDPAGVTLDIRWRY